MSNERKYIFHIPFVSPALHATSDLFDGQLSSRPFHTHTPRAFRLKSKRWKGGCTMCKTWFAALIGCIQLAKKNFNNASLCFVYARMFVRRWQWCQQRPCTIRYVLPVRDYPIKNLEFSLRHRTKDIFLTNTHQTHEKQLRIGHMCVEEK